MATKLFFSGKTGAPGSTGSTGNKGRKGKLKLGSLFWYLMQWLISWYFIFSLSHLCIKLLVGASGVNGLPGSKGEPGDAGGGNLKGEKGDPGN